MTDLREAAQMAFDALNNFDKGNHGMRWQVPIIKALRAALAQPENEFNPDWDAMSAMVEEQQRMAKRIEELTQLVTSQGIRLMDAEAQPEQDPVAFYVYKPTLPRGNLGNVADGDLPWIYDQNPSSGYSAKMLVYPASSAQGGQG